MFVYCDNHKSRSPVADFIRAEDGSWREDRRESSMRIAPGAETGMGIVMIGPENPRADEIRRSREMAEEYRRYELRCRARVADGRCGRNAVARGGKLFRYLDMRVADGVSAVSLSDIAANV